ncbi:MAG: hypothetical protein ACREPQ_14595 [Rhodanobacter sp.]
MIKRIKRAMRNAAFRVADARFDIDLETHDMSRQGEDVLAIEMKRDQMNQTFRRNVLPLWFEGLMDELVPALRPNAYVWPGVKRVQGRHPLMSSSTH